MGDQPHVFYVFFDAANGKNGAWTLDAGNGFGPLRVTEKQAIELIKSSGVSVPVKPPQPNAPCTPEVPE